MAKKELLPEVEFVNQFYKEGLDAREETEQHWLINLAFYENKQWARWNGTLKGVYTPKPPPNRKYITYNKIKKLVKDFVALVNTKSPTYEAIPINSSEKALETSEFIRRLIPTIELKTQNDIKSMQVDKLAAIYGSAYKMILWRNGKGKNKNGKYEGDIDIEVLSPFNIIKQTGVNKLEDCKRIMLLKFRDYEWISQTFPDANLEGVLLDSEETLSNPYSSAIDILRQKASSRNITNDVSKTSKSLLTKTLLERPSKEYPKGRMLITVNDVLLLSDELPYQFMKEYGELNILEYQYDPAAPPQPYPFGMVEDLKQPQKHYNIIMSMLHENFRATAKSKLLVPKNAGVSDMDLNNENGVIRYMPTIQGHTPTYISGQPMSPDAARALDMAQNAMTELSLGESLSGQNPENVRAAGHFQSMLEQSQRTLTPYIIAKEHQEAKLIKFLLELVKEKYADKRLVEITGKDSGTRVAEFKREYMDIADIRVVKGSSLPESKAAQTQYLVTLAQALKNPEIQQAAMANLGYGDIRRSTDMLGVDTENAIRETRLIEEGLPADLLPVDNHITHVMHHANNMKTESFKVVRNNPMRQPIPIVNPQTGQQQAVQMTIGQYAMYHLQQHQDYIERSRQIALQEQQMINATTQNINVQKQPKQVSNEDEVGQV